MTTATDVYGTLDLDDVVFVSMRRVVNPDGSRGWSVQRQYASPSLVAGVQDAAVEYTVPCTPAVVATLEQLIHDEVLVVDAPKMGRDLAA